MSLSTEASQLVATTDPAEVNAVIASFPDTDQIDIRENWNTLDPHLNKQLLKSIAARVEYLKELIAEYRNNLDRDTSRYNDLRMRGLGSLSDFDLCLLSEGDPLVALRCALSLKNSHISYNLSILKLLYLELDYVQKN